jgi:hypothetical protein
MKSNRQSTSRPHRFRTRAGRRVFEVQNERVFHCQAAFLAMLGIGAIDEEELEDGIANQPLVSPMSSDMAGNRVLRRRPVRHLELFTK